MYLGDIYTVSVNLAGLPGITVPCGLDKKGLPIGLQLIGDCFQEKKIIQAAYAFEQAREMKVSPIAEDGASVLAGWEKNQAAENGKEERA